MDRASIAAFNSAAAQVVKEVFGETVTIGGSTCQAAVGVPPYEGNLGMGGETFTGELLVSVLMTDLLEEPALNTEVVARGKTWIVNRVSGSGPMAMWNLRCLPKN